MGPIARLAKPTLIFFTLGSLLFSNVSFAVAAELSDVISYPEDQSRSGITVLETILLMNEVESQWRDEIQTTARRFSWDFHWQKPWLGAGGLLTSDGTFQVMLWGGIIRAEKMTLPGLEAVLCHEFGHLLGGKPKQIFPGEGEHWSSTEGQSDWWAATICLPRLYQARGLSRSAIKSRIREAGLAFALFVHYHFEKDLPEPSLLRHALEQPPSTLTLAYPSLQCRLDTYRVGADGMDSEAENLRPRCWFIAE